MPLTHRRQVSIEIQASSRESALQRRTGEMVGSPTNCSRPMHNPPSTGPKTNGLNLSEWALKHQQMVVFLLALLSIAGVLAYTQLGQKEDPEFTVKAMLVQAHWPGSSAQQMAEQVTDKLEKKLQEVAEIDYTTSYAKPGLTQITITLREDTPPAVVPQVWYQARKKLGDIAHTLPQGVKGPFFNDEFGDTFGNLYAITGDGFSYLELRDYADAARNEFLRVADVNKVDLTGAQDEKIYIEASNAKLSSLGIDPALIQSDVLPQHRAAAHLARRVDHRARTAGGRGAMCKVDMTHQWSFWPLMPLPTDEARARVALLPKLQSALALKRAA
jgi:AcrB/AcrD/AcrF family